MTTFARLGRYRIDAVLVLVALVWGGSYLAAKVLTEQASVGAVLALRFLVAALALLAVWALSRPRPPSRAELAVGVLLGLTQASILWLETAGVAVTAATNAGLIISLTIILTPILESVAARDWLPRPFFVAAVLAVVGVALLVSGNGFHAPNPGDLLMLAAAFVRALHVTMVGRLTRGGVAGQRPGTLMITLVQAIVGAVVFSAADAPGTMRAIGAFGPAAWLGVLYLGLACSVFAFLAQTWAIRRTSAARASLLMGTEPVWAVLVGVSLGSESLGPVAVLGAGLIIAGTFWGQRTEQRHRLSPAATPPAVLTRVRESG
ncbi:DMT family transporter [Cryobacterium sp. TMT2-10]|uniref:DMT family transporter n=1 Tax=Cryobacterium shii TaxID=1259235 RepID=A0AAQ2C6W3_9MICO|nr:MULTISPECIES: DMT family transporter [Cryobacterium]TFC48618.1 DMT family transporter [Cryobacterium shii]TFC86633.1 DMT family transporter [Cryobacterium sp. TmT2-59]TFD15615.1 DMT family transporter [Cryobacterium sp. TMT4-10]TFD26960.1 DMT family transporter [Cryobacterium sp. TMT2-23]TFD39604.1 DMT family transporter [Cryobacterium sp. TMT2-10]